jgi:regulation of enolase protein 1 (concanavalin A-like superfamily)
MRRPTSGVKLITDLKRTTDIFDMSGLAETFGCPPKSSWRRKPNTIQAGLMVRASKSCWLKTSIEHDPGGLNRLGVVVTNAGYSDWSTQDVAPSVNRFRLRVARTGADYVVEASLKGDDWTQLRITHLQEEGEAVCGVYACSPKAAGFCAEFRNLVITPYVEHALACS